MRLSCGPSNENVHAFARVRRGFVILPLVVCLTSPAVPAIAQDAPRQEGTPRPLLQEVATRVVLDPTTYAPFGVVYTARRLDWSTSQPLFRAGYVEANPLFTQSGLPVDAPIGFGAGNRRILRQSTLFLGQSIANNTACAVIERLLIERAPNHRKLIRTLGWVERIAFASYSSYAHSNRFFQQWQENQRLAREIAAR